MSAINQDALEIGQ